MPPTGRKNRIADSGILAVKRIFAPEVCQLDATVDALYELLFEGEAGAPDLQRPPIHTPCFPARQE
jgi:hypothetical protein